MIERMFPSLFFSLPSRLRSLFVLSVFGLVFSACDCTSGVGSDPLVDGGDGADASDPKGGDGGGDGNGSQGCETREDCAKTHACLGGKCVSRGAPCAGDGDCKGDRYCCSGDCLPEDEEGSFCVPYGEGPRGNTNDECVGTITIGLFEPDIQCEWNPQRLLDEEDAFVEHVNVLATPLVMDLPHDSGAAAEILIVSYNGTDGGAEAAQGTNDSQFGVIRILNGQTCATLESIHDEDHPVIAASTPAIGDLDGDGIPEIVTHRAKGGLIAFKWDEAAGKYTRYWVSDPHGHGTHNRWDGPAIHDLNDDGYPEVISEHEVFDGRTGRRLNPSNSARLLGHGTGVLAVIADVDPEADDGVELIMNRIYRWVNLGDGKFAWVAKSPDVFSGAHFAVADFGTPGATPDDFDFKALDGRAEIVTTGADAVRLYTLEGQLVFKSEWPGAGGPPTIGDFDGDGFPEIGVAGRDSYRVFDPDCKDNGPECVDPYLRWAQVSQDNSSKQTGSSIFDFEGDGQAEVVYADECFVRIYEGKTGEVLFSAYRYSGTWYENVVIADPDRDQNTEILVGSNSHAKACDLIDPIHPGTRCEDHAGCPSGSCVEGFCRCTSNEQCPSNTHCVAPLAGTPGAGNVCRAYHPPDEIHPGLRVLRDHLDRWASSRSVWNQHAYSVTNINDDGSVPRTSEWASNMLDPELNNFRQNVQGDVGSEAFPDITGRADNLACIQHDGAAYLRATVCNRGNRAVGAALPATFYAGDPADGHVLCTSYTDGPVPVGGCLDVSCRITEDVEGEISMVVNDDGQGGRTTVECNSENNSDTARIALCHYGPG